MIWKLSSPPTPRGVYFLMTPIRGCAAGQGVVFVLSVLNRVCNFAQDCPKQGNKIEGFVLNRECILGIFCPKQGQGLIPSAAHLYPNFGQESSSFCVALVESPYTSKFSKVLLPFIVSISDFYYICDQLLHLPSTGLGQTSNFSWHEPNPNLDRPKFS